MSVSRSHHSSSEAAWRDSPDPKVHAVKLFFMCLGQPQQQGNRGILQGSSPEQDLISDTDRASTSIGSLALHEMSTR